MELKVVHYFILKKLLLLKNLKKTLCLQGLLFILKRRIINYIIIRIKNMPKNTSKIERAERLVYKGNHSFAPTCGCWQ